MFRSRQSSEDQLQRLGKRNDSFSDPRDIVQVHHGYAGIWERPVARHRDNTLVGHMQGRAAYGPAKDFELWMQCALVSFDQNEIAGTDPSQELSQSGLSFTGHFVDLHPTPCRGHYNLARTGLAMFIRILSRMIDLEFVMSVLERRHSQATIRE